MPVNRSVYPLVISKLLRSHKFRGRSSEGLALLAFDGGVSLTHFNLLVQALRGEVNTHLELLRPSCLRHKEGLC